MSRGNSVHLILGTNYDSDSRSKVYYDVLAACANVKSAKHILATHEDDYKNRGYIGLKIKRLNVLKEE